METSDFEIESETDYSLLHFFAMVVINARRYLLLQALFLNNGFN